MKIDETRIECLTHLADICHPNSTATVQEQQNALKAAREMQITNTDVLRANLLFTASGRNTAQTQQWLREYEIEAGDYYDNQAILETARWRIRSGERERGLEELQQLREHIIQSKELNSFVHLLPEIKTAA